MPRRGPPGLTPRRSRATPPLPSNARPFHLDFWTPHQKIKFYKNGRMDSMAKVKGFKANQAKIAKSEGISSKSAGAILASASRKSSPAAKKRNPSLKKVK